MKRWSPAWPWKVNEPDDALGVDLEGGAPILASAQGSVALGVGRVEGQVVSLVDHRQSTVLEEDLDPLATVVSHVGPAVLLERFRRDLGDDLDALARDLEVETTLVHLQPGHPARGVAVEGDGDLVGDGEAPLAFVVRRGEVEGHLAGDVERQVIVLHEHLEALVAELAKLAT